MESAAVELGCALPEMPLPSSMETGLLSTCFERSWQIRRVRPYMLALDRRGASGGQLQFTRSMLSE